MKNILVMSMLLAVSFGVSRAQQPIKNKPVNFFPSASEDKQVCILGDVSKPSIISFESTITLMQAIKNTGGALPDMESSGARIYRSKPNSNVQEIIVVEKLKRLEKRPALDVVLQTKDVVEVVRRKKKKGSGRRDRQSQGIIPCRSWFPPLKNMVIL